MYVALVIDVFARRIVGWPRPRSSHRSVAEVTVMTMRWLKRLTACTKPSRFIDAPWKTKQAVEVATLEWVAWFNHRRLMEPLGYIPPAEAEANYYKQL